MLILYSAAILLITLGVAHSFLGERYVLARLIRLDNLPRLVLGGKELMVPVLRFAWHLTTVAWFGLAGIIILMAHDALSDRNVASVVALTFLLSAIGSGVPSRGRHLSWVVFLIIAIAAAFRAGYAG